MWKILAALRVVNIFDETICFSKYNIAWNFSGTPDVILRKTTDFPSEISHLIVIIINGLKDSFETTLNSLTSTRTNYRYHSLCDLFLTHSSSLKNIMAVKFL